MKNKKTTFGKFCNYDKYHLINIENGMIIKRSTDIKDIKHKDIVGFEFIIKSNDRGSNDRVKK